MTRDYICGMATIFDCAGQMIAVVIGVLAVLAIGAVYLLVWFGDWKQRRK